MFILTNGKNEIMEIKNKIEKDEKNKQYIIPEEKKGIPFQFTTKDIKGKVTIDKINLFEIEFIPTMIDDKVVDIKPYKYCYTEEAGFYKNTEYREYYSEEDRLSALEDMVNMIILGGNE